MGQTPIHSLPYPELSEPADVPLDIRELAEAVDAAIPAVTPIPPGGGVVNVPVRDVGVPGQTRAGRQLTAADFTSLGLAAPLGLWNLSSTADSSGNARTLTNKGAVTFGVGVNGTATTAAVFTGSTAQALYIDAAGGSANFNIKTGSWGCWFRTAKRATAQALVTKRLITTQLALNFSITAAANVVAGGVSLDGTTLTQAVGVSDVADDRWHHGVLTFDGTTVRLYVDGVLEATASGSASGPIFASSAPLNIGGYGADAGVASGDSHYGRVDEAFVTADVLSEDQVRLLYAAKLTHGVAGVPSRVRVNVHRKAKGSPFAAGDFAQPAVRLHNFTGGSLNDDLGGPALVIGGSSKFPVPTGGADGSPNNALHFAGGTALSTLTSTDAGLPQGTSARSSGAWFKTSTVPTYYSLVLQWGGGSPTATTIAVFTTGALIADSAADRITGPFVADGQWHFAVHTEYNAVGPPTDDGIKRKLWLDGRLVGASTVLNAITGTPGPLGFRVGVDASSSGLFTGQIDGVFVCAGALTQADVLSLYAKGSQDLGVSPKNAGDHVERMDATSVYFVGDTLASQHTVDIGVEG